MTTKYCHKHDIPSFVNQFFCILPGGLVCSHFPTTLFVILSFDWNQSSPIALTFFFPDDIHIFKNISCLSLVDFKTWYLYFFDSISYVPLFLLFVNIPTVHISICNMWKESCRWYFFCNNVSSFFTPKHVGAHFARTVKLEV